LGILLSACYGKPTFAAALIQSLVGTDYVATSFAFLFAMTVADPFREEPEKRSLLASFLVVTVIFFVLMKMRPIVTYETFSEFDPGNYWSMTAHSLFSLISVWLTVHMIRENERTR